MEYLRGLREITELEILISRERKALQPYDLDLIKSLGIQILQASECHKDCGCNYECGCAETNDCRKCNPPKRFLRVKTCPTGSIVQGSDEVIVDEGSCLEEIDVSPRRVLST